MVEIPKHFLDCGDPLGKKSQFPNRLGQNSTGAIFESGEKTWARWSFQLMEDRRKRQSGFPRPFSAE